MYILFVKFVFYLKFIFYYIFNSIKNLYFESFLEKTGGISGEESRIEGETGLPILKREPIREACSSSRAVTLDRKSVV